MGKPKITDKDVAYQIAQILVRAISQFQKPEDMTLPAAIEQAIDQRTSPLLTYAELAGELNTFFFPDEAKLKFSALNIDQFLGILLKESIDFSYKIDGIVHKGKIRRKLGCDLPITAVVVNSKTHIPGKQFFTYFDAPHTTDDQLRQTTASCLETLLAYKKWDEYLKRVEKTFGRK